MTYHDAMLKLDKDSKYQELVARENKYFMKMLGGQDSSRYLQAKADVNNYIAGRLFEAGKEAVQHAEP